MAHNRSRSEPGYVPALGRTPPPERHLRNPCPLTQIASPPPASYSVVIPAFNEEELLAGTLESIVTAMDEIGRYGEVIVVDNNSTDRTAKIAKEGGARVVFEAENQISRARNAGGRAAESDYLIFLDADTDMPPELLRMALEMMDSRRYCGGGAVLRMEAEGPLSGAPAAWNWISQTLKIACGCFIFCLRDAFDEVGGFSEEVYAGEEIWFSKHLKAWGTRRGLKFRIIEDPPIVSSNRKFEWFGTRELLSQVAIIFFMPFLTRNRRFCRVWYERPS